jgi:hypothetical protein
MSNKYGKIKLRVVIKEKKIDTSTKNMTSKKVPESTA